MVKSILDDFGGGAHTLSSAEALRLSLLFVCMYRSFWIVWMANGFEARMADGGPKGRVSEESGAHR